MVEWRIHQTWRIKEFIFAVQIRLNLEFIPIIKQIGYAMILNQIYVSSYNVYSCNDHLQGVPNYNDTQSWFETVSIEERDIIPIWVSHII